MSGGGGGGRGGGGGNPKPIKIKITAPSKLTLQPGVATHFAVSAPDSDVNPNLDVDEAVSLTDTNGIFHVGVGGVSGDGTHTIDIVGPTNTVAAILASLTVEDPVPNSVDQITIEASDPYGSFGSTEIHVDVACFCTGTLIRTARGEVAVEALAVGDRVATVSGALQPIVWIGRQTVPTTACPPEEAMPVRIKAGALGDSVPVRDLVVSPAHAIHIAGRLVPARRLLNGVSIVQEAISGPLDYWHIELPSHDVVIADGAPAESYLDTGNRRSLRTLDHADAYLRDTAAEPCFPLLEEGPELVRIRERLFARLRDRGLEPVGDPDLHLLVDGEAVYPSRREGDLHRFPIPSGAKTVRIVSRANAPIEVRPSASDTRRLGVALAALTLRAPGLTLRIAHDHPALTEGFHAPEKGHRWTTGDAHLPDTVLALLGDDGGEIELLVSGRLSYWPSPGQPGACHRPTASPLALAG